MTMKKILLSFLALGGLLFASSCQMNEPDAGTLTGEVDFSITAGIPSGITTYSPADGNAFSHMGGANNVDATSYDLRFILEVYDGEILAYRDVQSVDENFTAATVNFNARLLAKSYTFVLWADFVNEGSVENLYYNADNLKKISYTETVRNDVNTLSTDIADAYSANKVIDLSTSSKSESIKLQRPFGKIRLLATDTPVNPVDMANTTATITFKDGTKVPNTFNAFTGEASVSDPTLSISDYTFTAKTETNPVVTGHTDLTSAYLLGQTYLFESPSSTAYDMTVTVRNNGTQIGYRELTNIPVSANKLTTVIGNFYTNEGNIEVVIEDEFKNGEDVRAVWDGSSEEPDTDPDDANTYHITTPAELAWVAEQVNSRTEYFEGKTILLMNDIDLSGSYWTPVGNVNDYPTVTFKGTFDGKEHIISNLTASDDAAVYAAAGLFGSITGTVKNVTLKNVNIRSTHYAGAVVGFSSTNGATIENCHVDGGTITTVPEYTGSAYDNGDKAGGIIGYYVTSDKVTNCSAKNLTITAYRDLGGIVGCGPQSGMTDCLVENITLVQDNTNGYDSEAVTTVGALGGRDVTKGNQPYDGTFASAVTKKVVGNISDAQNLINALQSDAPVNITLTENVEVTGNLVVPADATLNLNGKTLTAKRIQAANDNSVIAITNGTVEFSGTGNGVELFAGNSKLTLDGVTLNASNLSGMAVCCGGIKYPEWAGNTIVIRNSTINAEQNSAVGIQLENAHNLTIENSTINHDYFGINQNGTNPGSTITLKDCNISGTYSGIYLSNYAGGTKNTLKVEGGKIHSEVESAIEVKKTDISVTGATLSSGASEQTYSVNGSGSSGTGYGIVLAGYAVGTPYEGETSFTNNTFILAAGENAVGILRYDGEKGAAVISSNEELAAAAIADNSTIYLTKGEYVIPTSAKGKTVTFVGTGNPEDVKVAVTKVGTGYENCDYGLDGSTVTFEGITITTNSSTYIGYARCKGTYKNCVINGTYTLYGDSKFENCTFNVSGDVYNIWTWGAPNATFDGCTFNSDGKAMLLYGTENTNLTIENSVFNDKGGLTDLKAAIEIGNDYDKSYSLVVNNTIVNGYEINDKGFNTGTTLWANKDSMGKEKLSVTVDGVKVY